MEIALQSFLKEAVGEYVNGLDLQALRFGYDHSFRRTGGSNSCLEIQTGVVRSLSARRARELNPRSALRSLLLQSFYSLCILTDCDAKSMTRVGPTSFSKFLNEEYAPQ